MRFTVQRNVEVHTNVFVIKWNVSTCGLSNDIIVLGCETSLTLSCAIPKQKSVWTCQSSSLEQEIEKRF